MEKRPDGRAPTSVRLLDARVLVRLGAALVKETPAEFIRTAIRERAERILDGPSVGKGRAT